MAESSGSTETGSGLEQEAAMSRNINKLIVTPPGYNGQPKRGHLIFDACFESGNLGRVDYITEFEYDLFIRPDTCNPRFRVWFNFTVENVKGYQRVIFNIVNFSKTKSLYRDGMSPVVKSTSRPKWQRLPSKNVYYYRCPDHRKNYVMSFAFCFDRENDVYQFAYCYPYTYTRLQHYLENLDKQRLNYIHRELLGLSVQQRRLDLLTITNPENKTDLEKCVLQRKIKIPKLCLNSTEGSWEFKEYEEDEDSERRHSKRPDGRKHVEGTRKSIEAVVARLEKQNGVGQSHNSGCDETFMDPCHMAAHMDRLDESLVPRVLYEELLRSYQQQQVEMRHIQHELERTRRQLVQQAKKLKDYGTLVTEVKELRVLNRRLQDVLLLRLGSVSSWNYRTNGIHGSPPVAVGAENTDLAGTNEGFTIDLKSESIELCETEPEIQKVTNEEANTSSFYPTPAPVLDKYILENGKVHLGSGVWVNEEKWHQLQATQGDSKYTKNLAVMIWGTDVLKNRSVTGVATKKKKDASPKPPLSPHKLSIIRECVYDRIAQETMDENEIAQRLSKVNKYICEKIMDINKSCKNEERREAKYSVQ
ncbi:BEN domain-containing protein 5-like isoform 1-T1 [Mantella aurantiaca]